MHPLKIVIVDPQDNSLERRANMVNAFTQLPNVQVTKYKKSDSNTEDVFLCIIHCGDNDLKDTVRAKWRIWYGGLEGKDNRAENGEYKIWRGISSDNCLTQEEAAQIIDFLFRDALGDIPECFFAPIPTLSSISALSILCQGYLATNSESNNERVKVALKQMGWDTFKDSSNDAKTIHTDLSKKNEETKQRCWWLEPFDINCKQPETEIRRQIDEVYEQIKKEWNVSKYGEVCSCIGELRDALKKSTSIDDPNIVANAYLAISHRLA